MIASFPPNFPWVRRLLAASLFALAAHSAQAAPARVCLSASEAREAIAEHHLADSFSVMRSAAQQAGAQALAAKLCRWSEQYVYEITLLERGGRVTHVFVGASDGKAVKSREAN